MERKTIFASERGYLERAYENGKFIYYLFSPDGKFIRRVSSVFAVDEMRELFPHLS